MIRLHHLNQSRSIRILWLLEELGTPYELVSYQRDTKTLFAPERLRAVHPLGKSPMIEIDGRIVTESGAITQLLIERFAPDRLRPNLNSDDYEDYLQWIHFAESSLMVPFLLDIFTKNAIKADDKFLKEYIKQEKHALLSYLDKVVANKSFIVGNKLSGADFMLAFDLIMIAESKELEAFYNLKQYALQLASLDSYQRAMRLENNYDQNTSVKVIK